MYQIVNFYSDYILRDFLFHKNLKNQNKKEYLTIDCLDELDPKDILAFSDDVYRKSLELPLSNKT